MDDENELVRLLSKFRCNQDEDVETFLHQRAIEFEKISKSRTYLICDQKQLLRNGINESLLIYGYISIALKVLSVPEGISNRTRKELDGFSAKYRGEQIKEFPCYLIGQLSRASNIPKDSIKGWELVEFACRTIETASLFVGGRYIMIECKDNPKLIQFYKDNEFVEISRISNYNHSLVQMIFKM